MSVDRAAPSDASAASRPSERRTPRAPLAAAPGRWLRRALGLALIAVIVMVANPAALWAGLRDATPVWVVIALVIAAAANLLAVFRWRGIALAMGVSMRLRGFGIAYFRSVSVNTVAPGGTVGGDVFRAVDAHRGGNPMAASAMSVALDRLLGLWAQATVSALAVGIGVLGDTPSGGGATALATGYLAALAAIVALPWTPVSALAGRAARLLGPIVGQGRLRRWAAAIAPVRASLDTANRFVRGNPRRALGVLALALVVALCMSATLWACLRAVGFPAPILATTAAAAGLFFAGSVPIAVGGFGPREAAAIGILGALAVPAPVAVSAAILYGLTATVQGLLAAPLFLVPIGPAARPAGDQAPSRGGR
jgi:uncharacterized membrane protein YbhN (UPF0104 family)